MFPGVPAEGVPGDCGRATGDQTTPGGPLLDSAFAMAPAPGPPDSLPSAGSAGSAAEGIAALSPSAVGRRHKIYAQAAAARSDAAAGAAQLSEKI